MRIKLKHTEGPWQACNNGECLCGMIWSVKSDCPVAVHTHMNILSNCEKDEGYNLGAGISNQSEEFKANVKLVAAAPELLEALVESTIELQQFEAEMKHTKRITANIQIIEKATGITINKILEDT